METNLSEIKNQMNALLDEAYAKLERSFVTYSELTRVVILNTDADKEPFTAIPVVGTGVIGRYESAWNDMEGESPNIIVRETVYKKLCNVDKALKAKNPNWQLVVAYGYRTLNIQQAAFNRKYEELKPKYEDKTELREAAHRYYAVPEVAGHPTGGAVDVTVYDFAEGKYLDFGTEILDFSTRRIYYGAIAIERKYGREAKDSEAGKNREMLRGLMGAEDFAPYEGEWWHFSYGDKEWAYYRWRTLARKKKEQVQFDDIEYLYGQKNFADITYTEKYKSAAEEKVDAEFVKFAVQKSGRLTDETIKLLESSGIDVVADKGKFFGKCENYPLELLFVRDDDIPGLVASGAADIGVVGENVLIESRCDCLRLLDLGFAKCSLALAVPTNSGIRTAKDLEGKKVATSYRVTTEKFFKDMGVKDIKIVELSGSVEIAPIIGYADAVADLVSTGNSLRQNRLKPLHTIQIYQSVLIGNDKAVNGDKKLKIEKLIQRFASCIKAKKFKSLSFSFPTEDADKIRGLLAACGRVTLESQNPAAGETLVQFLVEKSKLWDVIDELKIFNVCGIAVFDVEGYIP
ncbi:MAG: ATP phosphoribosyltransferase [Oscillospiraceae bacterium]|nr:ATP phosphoribosyltransferase [Oscillospiraceae bacterium]